MLVERLKEDFIGQESNKECHGQGYGSKERERDWSMAAIEARRGELALKGCYLCTYAHRKLQRDRREYFFLCFEDVHEEKDEARLLYLIWNEPAERCTRRPEIALRR